MNTHKYDLNGLKKLVKENRIIPFIGAGISLDAEFSDGTYPPSDKQLLELLFKEIDKSDLSINIDFEELYHTDRSRLTNIIKSGYGSEIGYKIRKLLNYIDVTPSQHLRILGLLRFEILITTNYDTIIEDSVYPRPEKLVLYNDVSVEHIIREINSNELKKPALIKLNGCKTEPESIALGSGIEYYNKYWSKTFELLYDWDKNISLLFIGYSLNDMDFIEFFKNIKKNVSSKKSKDFAIVTMMEYERLKDKPYIKELDIELIPYDVGLDDEDSASKGYNGLWQILSQLRVDEDLNMEPKAEAGVFFSKDERGKYLYCQDEIEKTATCLRYLTPSPTNAISPTDYIINYCRSGLVNLFNSKNFQALGVSVDEKSWVDEVIELMLRRQETITKRMEDGAELRVLCFRKQIVKDCDAWDSYIVKKYQYILQMIDNDDLDLEIRMLPDNEMKAEENSYALISSPNEDDTDIAIAYAAQASKGDFILHVVERNTRFVKDNLIAFESYWARAIDENTTREFIRKLFA